MGAAPARFNNPSEDRVGRLDSRLEDIEQRLLDLQLEEERLRRLEQNLLDASARRIHDFERRLEHEWLALRQLHEEPLKALNQHATSTVEASLNVVRESLELLRARPPESTAAAPVEPPQEQSTKYPRSTIIVVLAAVAALGLLYYRFASELERMETRTAAAEERTSQLQQLITKQIQDSERTVQRLSAESMTTAARAERLANILAAPDVRTYPLRGQRTSAAAEGQLFFSPSRGVALTASRVPSAPANQVFQVWVTTTRGPVSLGFASPDALGRASASFEMPAEIADAVIGFMLTQEPAGGSAKPTGPAVLAS